MEKEYLIHNIDYKDNPEDQHQTLDITISDLEIADQDITADVAIDRFVNGVPTSSNKYEDVSLTGAGGGGMSNANITIIPKLNGADIPGTIDTFSLQLLDLQFSDYTLNSGEFAYSDEQVEMPIKVPYINYADIQTIALSIDGGGIYIWSEAEPISIEGNATFNGSLIRITGDCTITIPVNED